MISRAKEHRIISFIYTVPNDWAFQHFLDGISPILSHSFNFLNKFLNAKVLILRGARFDRSVKEIRKMLKQQQVLFRTMACSIFNPRDLKACTSYILYTQSQLLNQTYWILLTVVNNNGNMNVNLTGVEKLLQQI
ncbi:hypothetical protein I4U23_007501 [Adineta vaga]|nr:hypothetical protein I4U23_007501 [Adineta vaga]